MTPSTKIEPEPRPSPWDEKESEYVQRLKYAEQLQLDGLSYKHSWFKAFQKYPKLETVKE